VLLQAAFAARWLSVYEFLVAPVIGDTKSHVLWAQNSLYGGLRHLLPHFDSPEHLFATGPNAVWVGLAVLCIVAGIALRRRLHTTLVGAGVGMSLAAAALVAWPFPDQPIVLKGASLRGSVGRTRADGRFAQQPRDSRGYVFVSPFLALDAGCYRVTLDYQARTPPSDPPNWEMTVFHPYPGTPLVIHQVRLSTGGRHQLEHYFVVPPGHHLEGAQLRVLFPGRGFMRVNSVTIEPDPSCG
jgi:hypothetical protein